MKNEEFIWKLYHILNRTRQLDLASLIVEERPHLSGTDEWGEVLSVDRKDR